VPVLYAPAHATTAGELCSAQADPCVVDDPITVASGSVIDVGQRQLLIAKGGDLDVGVGAITVRAGRLTMQQGGSVQARGDKSNGGGRITIVATLINIAGTVDASGADGGTVDLRAGMGSNGGITVAGTGVVTADALVAGGWGGTVKVATAGLAGEQGDVVLDGLLGARGKAGTQDTGGGSGGSIEVAAGGNIRGTDGARVLATGGGPDGDGGQIEFNTVVGSFALPALIDAHTTAAEGGGGSISISVTFDLTVNSSIDASGGGFDGGNVDFESLIGNVTVTDGGSIDVGGRQGGDGGSIEIDAAPFIPGRPASFTINGTLKAVGGGGGGDGGSISLLAADDMQIRGVVQADGGAGGEGGNVDILSVRGSVLVDGRVAADGSRNAGGAVWISAKGTASVKGEIKARGEDADGGQIAVDADGPVELVGTALASASGTGAGGQVTVSSGATITVSGMVTSDGGPGSTTGARVELEGCLVQVNAAATVSSVRGDGVNRLVGHEQTIIGGTLRAQVRNEVVYGSAARPPQIAGSADIQPPAARILDPTLPVCPTCGNGVIEPPETCDDGNQQSGDGCSAKCRLEPTPTATRSITPTQPSRTPTPSRTATPTVTPTVPPVCPGDCGGDGRVTVDELVRGVRIALGDDSVASCAAFDADESGTVTIDELVRGVRAALDGCSALVNPTPTPTPTGGATSCRLVHMTINDGLPGPLTSCVKSGGTCLLISGETGSPASNGTNGKFDHIPLPFEVCGPEPDGSGTIQLAETVYLGVGLPVPAVGKICMRFEPDPAPPFGFLDCQGGSNADVELIIDSQGEGPTGEATLGVGMGQDDDGPGAAVIRFLLQTTIVNGDRLADCSRQDYSDSPQQTTAFTTGTATTVVLNARHRLGDPVTASATMSGKPLDCSALDQTQDVTLVIPTYTFDVDIPVLGGVADFPQVLRLVGPAAPAD
jgi:cysteine-rich repeat protein